MLLLRFWIQAIKVNAPQQIQFIFRFTNWVVNPLRRIIPNRWGIEWAGLVSAYLIALASIYVLPVKMITYCYSSIFLSAFFVTAKLAIYELTGLAILKLLLSTANSLMHALNALRLTSFRKINPSTSRLDFTILLMSLLLLLTSWSISQFPLFSDFRFFQ